ncbi:MAG: dihydrofolate reductase family protein, partial [Candidatus Dormibacteraeota bacterium]|nr:dihydrofolate reductase family protein [Candidatus Dormibacteraeota bacterium]
MYANFVQSIDGVVAISGVVSSASVISGKSAADRFVMGLLRAAAGAVMVGAATVRDTPGHHWTAEHIYPDLAGDFAELRRTLGLPPRPRLVVLTGGGMVDVHHPAIRAGATFLTTRPGAERLQAILPEGCDLKAWDGEHVPLEDALEWLHAQGHERILSEAGPTAMGQLVRGGLVDDLFLTLSPVLAGRDGDGRPGLVAGAKLLPDHRLPARVAGVRRAG